MGLGHSPSIVASGLVLCLDPSNIKSYPTSGTTLYDISGNSNNGTLTNGTYVRYGNTGILSLDGSDDYVALPSLTLASSFTIEFWFKFNSYGGAWTGVVSNGYTQYGVTVELNSSGYIILYTSSNGTSWTNTCTSALGLSANTWYHYCGTVGSGVAKIYINGVRSGPDGTAANPVYNNTFSNPFIGKYANTGFYNGYIGALKIYNTTLTDSQVLQNYSATRGRFDNFYTTPIDTTSLVLNLDAGNPSSYSGSGTTWTSLTGSNNATLQNGPTFDTANGGTILFDGTNDYASCASSSDFAFGTGDFTLEMWIKHGTSGSAYQHLFALPDQNTFGLKAWDTGSYGELYFYSSTFDTYSVIPTSTSSGWVLDRNIWNHIVFTRASSVAYGYKNGILKGSKASFNNNFSSQTLNIGWGWGSEYRSKNIAVARIWKRALSQAEITSSFNALRGRFGL